MRNLVINSVVSMIFGWAAMSGASDQPPVENALINVDKTPVPVAAQATTPAPVAGRSAAPTKTEKTEHNFEDLLVQGKYHFSDEAVTTVEEDKVLDSLLGIRTDFKDKIEQSAGRY